MSQFASFSERLEAAIRTKKTPALVGLDPRLQDIPSPLTQGMDSRDFPRAAGVYSQFCRGIIDVVAPLVPAVKPQAAFFEQLGPPGMQALFEVMEHARQAGLLVLLDGKRNDIGSTAAGYAEAYLSRTGPWRADALTVSPYLGDDSLEPFQKVAESSGTGIFVLVKTSNPGGALFQDVVTQPSGEPLFKLVAQHVQKLAQAGKSPSGYGNVGAVVGATYPQQLAELRSQMPAAWFLIPGYGSQGGAASDVAAGFDSSGLGALVNSSRAINFAHKRPEYAHLPLTDWQRGVEGATQEMIADLAQHTPAGKLR